LKDREGFYLFDELKCSLRRNLLSVEGIVIRLEIVEKNFSCEIGSIEIFIVWKQ
jgi:hypothetical protein